jgi:hypothetical protein
MCTHRIPYPDTCAHTYVPQRDAVIEVQAGQGRATNRTFIDGYLTAIVLVADVQLVSLHTDVQHDFY